ncbi:hypothetical protein OS493_026647 [Desmophyllum pertusum]|uniref:Uncharacterized protein n=1 Tax=Desmophyllum pertusum TaxID=174260 RepID=A0A9W9YD21_9CNID|nr:hypothetical protein OS493_026647 [Desmophyllum pertusum]
MRFNRKNQTLTRIGLFSFDVEAGARPSQVRYLNCKIDRSKMSSGAVFTTFIVVLLFLAKVGLGAEYVLTGTSHFRVHSGEVVTVTGYYKYCLASTSCPTCIRQIYLNLFTTSQCLASLRKSQLDCKEHHFSKIYTAPNTAGSYDIKMEEVLDYGCNGNYVSSKGLRLGTVLVQERRPIIKQTILTNNADKLLQNDSVIFTVLLTHDNFSSDNALNTNLVWILPHYARFVNHVPKTNVSSPYPGEYHIQIGQIQLGSSVEINITVQIDPESTLSVGQHFLTIPTFTMYEQRMADGSTKMLVGSVESVTVNFTVREDFPRGFLMNPSSDEVYFCKKKKSDWDPSCFKSIDGARWIGLDSRVKMISGMIIRRSYTRIFAMATGDRCHVVSEDGLTWSCIMPEEWQHESSSKDFVHAIFVPRNLKSNLPEGEYIASKSDGTIFLWRIS